MLSYALCCLLVVVAPVRANDAMTFSTDGFGKVFYSANMCDMVVGVRTEDWELATCREQHESARTVIRGYLKELRDQGAIAAESATKLKMTKERRESNTSELMTKYTYTTQYTIRLMDVPEAATIQTRLVELGVNQIESVTLLSDELPEHMDHARRLAIADSRAKAELAAEALGWGLLRATNISFQEVYTSRLEKTFGDRESSRNSVPDRLPAEVYADSTVRITWAFVVDDGLPTGDRKPQS
jgi:hypothetical protein